jgi:hypothetical protein
MVRAAGLVNGLGHGVGRTQIQTLTKTKPEAFPGGLFIYLIFFITSPGVLFPKTVQMAIVDNPNHIRKSPATINWRISSSFVPGTNRKLTLIFCLFLKASAAMLVLFIGWGEPRP